ncbi:MAG: FecR domain-containing protein, partial [Candidatus Neomarinimicrobiota bacterium]|nr:FecR domain-containing protein [Candidatus Neomarinimicrobiota bacterium]
MKRIIVLILMSTLLMGSSKVAVAIKVKGKVSIIPAETKVKKPLKPGTPLSDQDKIMTAKGAFAALMYLDDKSVVKMMGNSDLVVAGNRSSAGINKSLDISYGKITANIVQQKGREFRIATPTSVA